MFRSLARYCQNYQPRRAERLSTEDISLFAAVDDRATGPDENEVPMIDSHVVSSGAFHTAAVHRAQNIGGARILGYKRNCDRRPWAHPEVLRGGREEEFARNKTRLKTIGFVRFRGV